MPVNGHRPLFATRVAFFDTFTSPHTRRELWTGRISRERISEIVAQAILRRVGQRAKNWTRERRYPGMIYRRQEISMSKVAKQMFPSE